MAGEMVTLITAFYVKVYCSGEQNKYKQCYPEYVIFFMSHGKHSLFRGLTILNSIVLSRYFNCTHRFDCLEKLGYMDSLYNKKGCKILAYGRFNHLPGYRENTKIISAL